MARRIRGQVVSMSHRAGTPHLGSSLSCVDILVALYWGALALDPRRVDDPRRDRVILSKGHAAPALYAALAFRGFFDPEILESYNRPGSKLEEHPGAGGVPGVEVATGSLGHGLSLGLGMALAGRLERRPYRVYVVLSDGECNEGSVWEAAMFAPQHRLDNLVAIIDFNKMQCMGRTSDIIDMEPFSAKWEAFGWAVREVDGHNLSEMKDAFSSVPIQSNKPTMFIAHTTLGKGVSFMEDRLAWHYLTMTQEVFEKAIQEVNS